VSTTTSWDVEGAGLLFWDVINFRLEQVMMTSFSAASLMPPCWLSCALIDDEFRPSVIIIFVNAV